MRNQGTIKTRNMKTPARDYQAEFMWLGYCDARQGLPFCKDYDGWPEPRQRNYEWGRGLAIAAKVAMGNAPAWPRNRYITRIVPRDVTIAEWSHHEKRHA